MIRLGQPEPENTVIMVCACGCYMEANIPDGEIRPLEIEGHRKFNFLNLLKWFTCCSTYSNCNDYDGFFYIGKAYSK